MKLKLKLIRKLLFGRGRYKFLIFDRERPPTVGDTITVDCLIAEFKMIKKGKFNTCANPCCDIKECNCLTSQNPKKI